MGRHLQNCACFPLALILGIGVCIGAACWPVETLADDRDNAGDQPATTSKRTELLTAASPLFQDGRGDIWRLDCKEKRYTLARWENQSWRAFPVPTKEAITEAGMANVAGDNQGRIWVAILNGRTAVSVFSPPDMGMAAEGRWTTYLNFAEAILCERKPDFRFVPLPPGERLAFLEVVEGPRGQIAFCTPDYIYLYDGSTWRSWSYEHVTHEHGFYSGARVVFDDKGHLEYGFESYWAYTPEGGWWPVRKEECKIGTPRPSELQMPPYADPNPDTVAQDQFGTFWLQYGDKLCRAGMGLFMPVFRDDEATPLVQGRWVVRVLADASGGAYCRLGRDSNVYLHILPLPAPILHASLARQKEDSATIDVAAESQGKTWFTWRVDDGDWQNAVEKGPIEVSNLSDGEHNVQVVAIGEHFATDFAPAELRVTIKSTMDETTRWIADLASPDYAKRNKAVQSLASKPEESIPALREARKAAGPGLQWWIDAALQAAESPSGATKAEGSKP